MLATNSCPTQQNKIDVYSALAALYKGIDSAKSKYYQEEGKKVDPTSKVQQNIEKSIQTRLEEAEKMPQMTIRKVR